MSSRTKLRVGVVGLVLIAAMWMNVGHAQLVTDGLVAYWPLDSDSVNGDTVKDVWGDNDGTMTGKPKQVAGIIGGALKFDGASGVEIPGTDVLNFAGKSELTATAWVATGDKDPVQGVVAGCCGSIVAQRDVNGWALRYDGRNGGQEMEFIVNTGNWMGDGGFGAQLFPVGEWHQLTAILSDSDMLLYLDGELVDQMPSGGGKIASAGTKVEIGKAGDGGFVGKIDEVAIYSRALTEKEVKLNFTAKGLAVDPAGKLATRWAALKQLP